MNYGQYAKNLVYIKHNCCLKTQRDRDKVKSTWWSSRDQEFTWGGSRPPVTACPSNAMTSFDFLSIDTHEAPTYIDTLIHIENLSCIR